VQAAEFDRAFAQAKAKYPNIFRSIAWAFALNFEAALQANYQKPRAEQTEFGLLIRLKLNEANISEKSDRTMYAALIGFLFGKRGIYKKANMRRLGIPRARGKKQSPPSYEVGVNEKGQLGWKL
jgi:hypothetical protein